MRAIIYLSCLGVILLLAGCFKFDRPATLASAESFTKLLIEELRQSGEIQEWGKSGGQAGNIYTRDFSRTLPSESFPPGRLYVVAQAALAKWGEFETYSTRGSGGGDNHFRLHYGNRRSHAFIDVTAYPERETTRVDFQIRVVE